MKIAPSTPGQRPVVSSEYDASAQLELAVEPPMPPPAVDNIATLGSANWWSSFGVTLCGKRVSNEKAKLIIYAGGAALAIVSLALLFSVTGTSAEPQAVSAVASDTKADLDDSVGTTLGDGMSSKLHSFAPVPHIQVMLLHLRQICLLRASEKTYRTC